MEYPVEKVLSYPLLALFVLAVFYGIYFVKMLAQKPAEYGRCKSDSERKSPFKQ